MKEKPEDYYYADSFLCGVFYAILNSYIKSIEDYIDEQPKKLQLEASLRELQRKNIYFFFRIGSDLYDAIKLIQTREFADLRDKPAEFLSKFCEEYPKLNLNNSVLFTPVDFNFMKEGYLK